MKPEEPWKPDKLVVPIEPKFILKYKAMSHQRARALRMLINLYISEWVKGGKNSTKVDK